MTLRVEARVVRGEVAVDAEFEARAGITVFFGPSGVGKSTTLAAVAGLLRPSSGRITLGDDVWFDAAAGVDRPVHTRRLGFVFQSLALFPHLDGLSNVLYGMDAPSLERTRTRARETLERLGVGHLAGRRPATFSGGEAQRVALARVFAREPSLLLLDEPFSALDRDLRRELGAEVRRYVDERRIPALFVTHHRREAKHLGDAVVAFDRTRRARSASFDTIDDD